MFTLFYKQGIKLSACFSQQPITKYLSEIILSQEMSQQNQLLHYLLSEAGLNSVFANQVISTYFDGSGSLDSLILRKWLLRNILTMPSLNLQALELKNSLLNLQESEPYWLCEEAVSPEQRFTILLHSGTGSWSNYRKLRQLHCQSTHTALYLLKQVCGILHGFDHATLEIRKEASITSLDPEAWLSYSGIKIVKQDHWDGFVKQLTNPLFRPQLRSYKENAEFYYRHLTGKFLPYRYVSPYAPLETVKKRKIIQTKKTSITALNLKLNVPVFGEHRYPDGLFVGVLLDLSLQFGLPRFIFVKDLGTSAHAWIGSLTEVSAYRNYAASLTFPNQKAFFNHLSSVEAPVTNEWLIRLNREMITAIVIARDTQEAREIAYKRQSDMLDTCGKFLPILMYSSTAHSLSELSPYTVKGNVSQPDPSPIDTQVMPMLRHYHLAMLRDDFEALSSLFQREPDIFLKTISDDPLFATEEDRLHFLMKSELFLEHPNKVLSYLYRHAGLTPAEKYEILDTIKLDLKDFLMGAQLTNGQKRKIVSLIERILALYSPSWKDRAGFQFYEELIKTLSCESFELHASPHALFQTNEAHLHDLVLSFSASQ